ncbi:hypothetical protein SMAC4_06741 [Sordaria macrospora]|uniref:uncharacterized protein n=1 Tax=Sordaria macrospora TaxID=5147 RepID=UPI002B29EC6B|nr:hypothetical protein SMAC4_06741 [Sordaria macrospora]
MVFYFTSTVVDPPAFVYVGKDKFENEELIKHGWEEDVCSTSTNSPVPISTFVSHRVGHGITFLRSS